MSVFVGARCIVPLRVRIHHYQSPRIIKRPSSEKIGCFRLLLVDNTIKSAIIYQMANQQLVFSHLISQINSDGVETPPEVSFL